jgi:hypothetical protein
VELCHRQFLAASHSAVLQPVRAVLLPPNPVIFVSLGKAAASKIAGRFEAFFKDKSK